MLNDSFEIVSCDERGYMFKCKIRGKSVFIIFTKRGFARGGEFHPVIQYTAVISGKVMYKTNCPDGEKNWEVRHTGVFKVPANIAHVMVALEDSITIEWHDGELPPFEQKKIYEPYREFIKRNYFEDV